MLRREDRIPSNSLQRSHVLLVGGGAGWVVLLAAAVLGWNFYEGVGLVGFLTFASSWVGSRLSVRDVAERPVTQVDEYEMVQRARVRDIGYVVALASLVLGFVLLTAGVKLAERGDNGLLYRCPHLIFVGFLAAAALPTFLLLWRTRDNHIDPEM